MYLQPLISNSVRKWPDGECFRVSLIGTFFFFHCKRKKTRTCPFVYYSVQIASEPTLHMERSVSLSQSEAEKNSFMFAVLGASFPTKGMLLTSD